MKKNIFTELNDRKVCYAIIVYMLSVFNKAIGHYAKEYAIIVSPVDKEQVKDLNFRNSYETEKDVLERKLTEKEEQIFKSLQDDFTKVIHNESGRVYELKGNSFYKHYKVYEI